MCVPLPWAFQRAVFGSFGVAPFVESFFLLLCIYFSLYLIKKPSFCIFLRELPWTAAFPFPPQKKLEIVAFFPEKRAVFGYCPCFLCVNAVLLSPFIETYILCIPRHCDLEKDFVSGNPLYDIVKFCINVYFFEIFFMQTLASFVKVRTFAFAFRNEQYFTFTS